MNAHEIRVQIHAILDSHAEALQAIRDAHGAMQVAFTHHDTALVSAIEANRSALRLLNRLMNEGVDPEPEVTP
jgi:thiamine phosphate synthase YjbQ (UPF0047 family)